MLSLFIFIGYDWLIHYMIYLSGSASVSRSKTLKRIYFGQAMLLLFILIGYDWLIHYMIYLSGSASVS